MSAYEKFKEKLTKQPVYFAYDFEDAVIRSEPNKGFWVKFKGEPEFKALPGSGVVAEAIREHKEISKSQYDNF